MTQTPWILGSPGGTQPTSSYHLSSPRICVEVLGKVTFLFSQEQESWGFLGLPVEAEWGPPACVSLPWATGPSAGREGDHWLGWNKAAINRKHKHLYIGVLAFTFNACF